MRTTTRSSILIRFLYVICWILLPTLVHVCVTLLIWDGEVALFSAEIDREMTLLTQMTSETNARRLTSRLDAVYYRLIIDSGFRQLAYQRETNYWQGLLINHWRLVQTLLLSAELLALRLCVLLMSLPLIVMLMLSSFTIGLTTWYKRRTGCYRESAYLYHNAKHSGKMITIGLFVMYLSPPLALDPRSMLPPFICALMVCNYFYTAYFKKFL